MELTASKLHQAKIVNSRRMYHSLKRVMDLAIAFVIFPMMLPLLAVIALIVRLDSPGPAIFRQKRVGKDGRLFEIYKFRTMQHNLDDTYHKAFMKAFVKGELDQGDEQKKVFKPFTRSQVTRVGNILRKTSLDELPQLFNIIKGDMSLIGPRPNVVWEVEAYKGWHMERLSVLPGITGWAQVNGRSGIAFDTIASYDIEYVRSQGLWMDVKILWKTFASIIDGKGAA